MPFSKPPELYKKAMVYAQLSYYESFGVALAEVMASGCVPVVIRKATLPEVAGECGIYVPYGNAESSAITIQELLGVKNWESARRTESVRCFH